MRKRLPREEGLGELFETPDWSFFLLQRVFLAVIKLIKVILAYKWDPF